MLNSYRDLLVWQKGTELVKEVYTLTARYPKTEQFGLTSQSRRAAVAIPTNIAEGYARKHRKEYAQFIRIAYASGAELETELLLAGKLNLAPKESFLPSLNLLKEVMPMLNKLTSSLESSNG